MRTPISLPLLFLTVAGAPSLALANHKTLKVTSSAFDATR